VEQDWKAFDTGASRVLLVGPVLQAPLTAEILQRHELGSAPQIAVDGGIRFALRPILWAGDGDSGTPPADSPVFFKHSQDETDLHFCLKGIRDWRWSELYLLGFMGARPDHELANYGEIYAEMKKRGGFSRAVFHGADLAPRVVFLQAGAHKLDIHGTFSVLALENAVVSMAGACAYAADKLALQPLSGQGVSNEGSGSVSLACDKPLMVVFSF